MGNYGVLFILFSAIFSPEAVALQPGAKCGVYYNKWYGKGQELRAEFTFTDKPGEYRAQSAEQIRSGKGESTLLQGDPNGTPIRDGENGLIFSMGNSDRRNLDDERIMIQLERLSSLGVVKHYRDGGTSSTGSGVESYLSYELKGAGCQELMRHDAFRGAFPNYLIDLAKQKDIGNVFITGRTAVRAMGRAEQGLQNGIDYVGNSDFVAWMGDIASAAKKRAFGPEKEKEFQEIYVAPDIRKAREMAQEDAKGDLSPYAKLQRCHDAVSALTYDPVNTMNMGTMVIKRTKVAGREGLLMLGHNEAYFFHLPQAGKPGERKTFALTFGDNPVNSTVFVRMEYDPSGKPVPVVPRHYTLLKGPTGEKFELLMSRGEVETDGTLVLGESREGFEKRVLEHNAIRVQAIVVDIHDSVALEALAADTRELAGKLNSSHELRAKLRASSSPGNDRYNRWLDSVLSQETHDQAQASCASFLKGNADFKPLLADLDRAFEQYRAAHAKTGQAVIASGAQPQGQTPVANPPK